MEAIVATSKNNVIGNDGGIPWKCEGDLAFFKRRTMGRKIVVGRKTFDQLPPLPGREIYVLTSKTDGKSSLDNVTIINDIDDVPEDAIVCGGGTLYDQLIGKCDTFYVSFIDKSVHGDTPFKEEWLVGFTYEFLVDRSREHFVIRYVRKH